MSAAANNGTATALDIEHYPDIIDARSEGEYAEDFIPGALNHPVLSDDERVRVGTLNARASAFEAKRMGAALVRLQWSRFRGATILAGKMIRELLSRPLTVY